MIRELQDAIIARAKDSGGCGDPPAVPIYAEDISNFETTVRIALDKTGMVVVVGEPKLSNIPNFRGMIRARVWIDVYESFLINQSPSGTRKRASALAWELAAILTWDDRQKNLPWYPDNWGGAPWVPPIIAGVEALVISGPVLHYRITFESDGHL